ncbi:glutaminyl-peptide cyclotransferase [Parapedobacter sp. GCM10030251]|uniref:glutaminyl-peptide cyclotransferase n=1 Tax=Parapedobacter sp. GCM10030251 TaxID=3273419 RepID=UPI00360C57E3
MGLPIGVDSIQYYLDNRTIGTEIYDHKAQDNEMNGIAYNNQDSTLYVTGKMWPYLFEIKPVAL